MRERLMKGIIEKRKRVLAKFNTARKTFKKKEDEVKRDLEEAGRIWRETGEILNERKEREIK